MATRNLIMVVDRDHSSRYPEGFAIHPDLVQDKSYVNMYMHHDGYPEWQGVQIANWLLAGNNGCQLCTICTMTVATYTIKQIR